MVYIEYRKRDYIKILSKNVMNVHKKEKRGANEPEREKVAIICWRREEVLPLLCIIVEIIVMGRMIRCHMCERFCKDFLDISGDCELTLSYKRIQIETLMNWYS